MDLDPRRRKTEYVHGLRREFLAEVGLGFAGLTLASMLAEEGVVRGEDSPGRATRGSPGDQPGAKAVIWIFLSGGYSHLETFDPKPAFEPICRFDV